MTRRPCIAVDVRALVGKSTGIGVHTRSLLSELQKRQCLRLVGMAHRPVDGASNLAEEGVELESHGGLSGVIWQQLRLPRRLRRGDVDIFWSPLQTLPLGASIPCVTTIHDLTALLYPETHSQKVRWSQMLFLERSLELARRVVAVSQATAADLERHFPGCRDRIRIVPNGVDPCFQPATQEEKEAIRNDLEAPRGYVLYAGTVEPRKNLETLLNAWDALADRARVPLFLAGPWGWKSEHLKRRLQASDESRVRHLGRLSRDRLVQVIQGARVFVYPSLAEGFGLPPAEAMACGVPVVVSRAPSLLEVVGDAGLAVETSDSADLAGAVALLLESEQKAAELAHRGLEQVQQFTWSRAADGLESVFHELLEDSRPSPG